jgi:hypothetical protein
MPRQAAEAKAIGARGYFYGRIFFSPVALKLMDYLALFLFQSYNC